MAGADNKAFRGLNTRTRMVYRLYAYFEKRIALIRGLYTRPSKFIPALFCPKFLPLITILSFRLKTCERPC
jgi:hypothetical protein